MELDGAGRSAPFRPIDVILRQPGTGFILVVQKRAQGVYDSRLADIVGAGSNVISTDFNLRKLQMLSVRKCTEYLQGQSTSVRERRALQGWRTGIGELVPKCPLLTALGSAPRVISDDKGAGRQQPSQSTAATI